MLPLPPSLSLYIYIYSAMKKLKNALQKMFFLGISNTVRLIKLLLFVEHIFRYSVFEKVSHTKVSNTIFFTFYTFFYI